MTYTGDGVKIGFLGGNCPVQAEGTFDGEPFYFRARGTSVTCDVGDWTWVGPEYEWPDAGWISEAMASAYIEEAYRAWKRPDRDADARQRASYRRRNGHRSAMMRYLMLSAELDARFGVGSEAGRWALERAKEMQAKAEVSE